MPTFLLLLSLPLILATLWIVRSKRAAKPGQGAAELPRPRIARAQTRPLDTPTHLNDQAFAKLLRAARGDRSKVEEWIMAEQRMLCQLNRDHAISRIVMRLDQSRQN